MEIVVPILSLMVIIFFWMWRREVAFSKGYRRDIKALSDRNRNTIKQLEEKKGELKWIAERILELDKSLIDQEILMMDQKDHLEKMAARHGLRPMDDGQLYRMIKDHAKMDRMLMANWLPYGKALGQLELIEIIKGKLNERQNKSL